MTRGSPKWTLLIVSVAACGGGNTDDPAESSVSRVDSAGVEIVEAHGEQWSEDEGWRVSDTALMEIGGVPGEELFMIRGAFRLSDGSVVIGNRGTSDIRIHGPDGRLERSVGREGEGPGEFSVLFGISRVADTIVAHDFLGSRISHFAADGGLLRDVTLPRDQGALPVVVTVGPGGYVATYNFYPEGVTPEAMYIRRPVRLSRFDWTGQFLGVLTDVAGQEMVVAESHLPNGGMVTTSSTPIMGRSQWLAATDEHWVVATSDRFELLVFGASGALERIIRAPYRDQPVADADWARAIEETIEERSMAQNPRNFVEDLAELVPRPDVRPAFSGVVGDADGFIWVRPYRPVPDLPVPWLIVDPAGPLLGTVDLPPRFVPTEIGHDYVLGRYKDEFDVEYVRVYRLNRE